MNEANAFSTQMVSGSVVSAFDGDPFPDVYLYSSTVGALQYVTITRSKLAYSIKNVCQFMHACTFIHWQPVKRILRYIAGTFDHGLVLCPPSNIDTRICRL